MTNKLQYTETYPLLTVDNVGLVLQGKTILREANAQVKDIIRAGMKQGQVIGFLGPSGIGKTQFFRIIAGLQAPTSGKVLLGKDQHPVAQGMVGVVAQRYPLFMHRTVIGNLIIGSMQSKSCYGRKEARERAYAMLERFKLADKADSYPSQLSGGQQQRIAIAQQMLCDGHFLLMDEPFSGLDLIMKAKVTELINEIATMDEENTIIVITHVIEEAASVADELWLMGRDRDEKGDIIPGARIQQTYDLKELGLAWQPDIARTREFIDFAAEVKQRFMTL